MDTNVKVYIRKLGNDSKVNKLIIKTFDDWGIQYDLLEIKKYFPKNELIYILKRSDYGFESVVASRAKILGNVDIDDMKFSEAINFMINNTSTIKLPIIISDQRLYIGRNIKGLIDFLK